MFRCDRITSIEEELTSHFSIDELINLSLELYQSEHHIDFEVEIAVQGVDIFFIKNIIRL